MQFDYNRVTLHETEHNDTGYINATLAKSGQKEGSFWQDPDWHYIVTQVPSLSAIRPQCLLSTFRLFACMALRTCKLLGSSQRARARTGCQPLTE